MCPRCLPDGPAADQRYFKEYFSSLPPESRVRQCKDMMIQPVGQAEHGGWRPNCAPMSISLWTGWIEAAACRDGKSPAGLCRRKFAAKIEIPAGRSTIRETFFTWLETGRKIVCEPSYRLPVGNPSHKQYRRFTEGSLYEAEDGDMNTLEQDLVKRVDGHSQCAAGGTGISPGMALPSTGTINHYPDIMIMTQSGKINPCRNQGRASEKRRQSGERSSWVRAWRNAAGNQYRYYMVFRDEEKTCRTER